MKETRADARLLAGWAVAASENGCQASSGSSLTHSAAETRGTVGAAHLLPNPRIYNFAHKKTPPFTGGVLKRGDERI